MSLSVLDEAILRDKVGQGVWPVVLSRLRGTMNGCYVATIHMFRNDDTIKNGALADTIHLGSADKVAFTKV